jgi:hypothetical protein
MYTGTSDSELESENDGDGDEWSAGLTWFEGDAFPDEGLVMMAGATGPFLRFGGASVVVLPLGDGCNW